MLAGVKALVVAGAAAAVVIAAVPHSGVDRARARASVDPSAPMIRDGPTGRIALNGPWILRSDHADKGAKLGWAKGGFTGSAVTVPNAANATRVVGPKQAASFFGTVAWYRTSFTVPADGRYVLRMESVNHKALVWVDGKLIAHHTGVYLPFKGQAQLQAGTKHTLVIRANYRNPYEMKRMAWHRTWFNFGGVNREVTIRKLSASDLTTPTVRTRLRADGSARVDVTVHATNRGPDRRLPVVGRLSHGDEKLDFRFPTEVVPHGQTRVLRTSLTVKDPKLWAPGSPNLYDVDLRSGTESENTFKTGLREIRKSGTRLLLNGRPIVLKGASINEDALNHGDAMTGADMDEFVRELKAIGANATRAQHALNPALMERLDAAGIMVWLGVGPVDAPGAWTSNTPKLIEQAKNRVRTTYFQLQTHPSLIVWNLANEVAGNGHRGGQAQYIDAMAKELHRRDPGRLVGLDVWGTHPPKKAGLMYRHIDAIGDTSYIGWYERTLDSRASIGRAIREQVAEFKRVFEGKILAVTEFGAEANSQNRAADPGGYAFQSALLRQHIDIYRADPRISGILVWNLRDFAVTPAFYGGSIRHQVPDIKIVRGLNQKGLFTYGGRPKPSVKVVRDALAGH